MKRAIIAAATLTLLAIPGLAYADSYGRDRWGDDVQTRSVEVYTGDLNVADSRDESEARRRIRHAADYVCQPRADLRDLPDSRDYKGCRAEAYYDAVDELHERAGLSQGRVYTRERPAPSGR